MFRSVRDRGLWYRGVRIGRLCAYFRSGKSGALNNATRNPDELEGKLFPASCIARFGAIAMQECTGLGCFRCSVANAGNG
jgi:hypothetical protein